MRDREPTIRSRELGEGLREAMVKAGLNGAQAAYQLGWSTSRVSRLFSGKRGGSPLDVASFLAICRVTGQERDRLLSLCEDQNKAGWFQQHGSRLPKQLRTLIDHEKKAINYSDVQPMLVPGLLQTEDYARAVISGSINVPADEVEERVAARLARQSVFAPHRRAEFDFFLHESVLRTPVGGPAVMSDQLHHLLRMSVRSYLQIHVIPTGLGVHAATAGPFILMEFAEFRPITYLESETSSLFLEKPEEIAAYRRVLAALADTALDEEQSKELIANVAVELYADRENLDDLLV
jgi:transcriptional regulator with XRE-family HTH domain